MRGLGCGSFYPSLSVGSNANMDHNFMLISPLLVRSIDLFYFLDHTASVVHTLVNSHLGLIVHVFKLVFVTLCSQVGEWLTIRHTFLYLCVPKRVLGRKLTLVRS